jgi:type II secretory pathway pseudopilin PulG
MERRSHTRQMIGSLLVALAIVALAIAVVTGQFGPTSAAEIELKEERMDQREKLRDERRDAREERREARQRRNEP